MEVLVDSEGLAEPEADSVRTVTAVTGIPAMEEKNHCVKPPKHTNKCLM